MSPPRSTRPRRERCADAQRAHGRRADRPDHAVRDRGRAGGPEIGAIFDFDGTLLAGYSILAFLTDRVRRRDIALAEIGRTAKSLLEALAGDLDNRELLERGLAEWRGRELADMHALGERLFAEALEADLFPEMQARIAAHRRMGHALVIASSATAFQVEPARATSASRRCCARVSRSRTAA
ncbi:MAG: haloacid dehalogenase-like hydrolase [Steroidobacteraceae bacterium]